MGLRPKHGRPLDPRAVGARPADAPGGTYFSQQVGPASMAELSEAFLGPLPDADRWRRPQDARAAAVRSGLDVVNLRTATLRAEFHDVGAIVYLLRKCVVGAGLLRGAVSRHVARAAPADDPRGTFVAHASRFLLEAGRMGR